jgi:plastocyanin
MAEKSFLPSPISVRTGDIVTWKNTAIETYTVTSGLSDGSSGFDSGLLDTG